MNIKPVSEILNLEGLSHPKLNVLIPNENNYKVLLMQPQGHIEADANGVRNRDRELAKKQFSAFLKDARQTQTDLAITPEYSMPWETLFETVRKRSKNPIFTERWSSVMITAKSINRWGLYHDTNQIKRSGAGTKTPVLETAC